MKEIVSNLIGRSQEALTLAIELFNRPTLRYRIEAFCFFCINAWELLLKAYIIQQSNSEDSVLYKRKTSQPQRSLSLRDALTRVMPSDSDLMRRNVEEIAELRDQAMHLLIPDLETVYGGVFQAAVLNYVHCLKNWFSIDFVKQRNLPFLTLIAERQESLSIIGRKYGKDAVDFLRSRAERIEAVSAELNDRRFAIPIEYKVVFTKKPGEADITLVSGPESPETARIVEVPKDLSITHPYTQKTAVAEIDKQLPEGYRFTSYDFQAVAHKEKWKSSNNNYHHCLSQANNTHVYSKGVIDFAVDKVAGEPNFLTKVRKKYGDYLQKRRANPRGREHI